MGGNNTLLIIAGAIIAYLLYEQSQTSTAATGTTNVLVSGAAAGTVSLAGPVSLGPQNSLQANFIINGVQQAIAVVPNGDAFNPSSWQDLTQTLAAQGVTPSQLYLMMQADYAGVSNTAGAGASTGSTSSGTSTNPLSSAVGGHGARNWGGGNGNNIRNRHTSTTTSQTTSGGNGAG